MEAPCSSSPPSVSHLPSMSPGYSSFTPHHPQILPQCFCPGRISAPRSQSFIESPMDPHTHCVFTVLVVNRELFTWTLLAKVQEGMYVIQGKIKTHGGKQRRKWRGSCEGDLKENCHCR